MLTHACTRTVGYMQLHRTGTPIILVTPTNGQNAGDWMPNAGRREKDPKCGRVGSSASWHSITI